ncbi:hypothetical protein [Sporosarcina globispora]|nr:hypothetical protein [Sporosarcina globispora]
MFWLILLPLFILLLYVIGVMAAAPFLLKMSDNDKDPDACQDLFVIAALV